jgi:hypothetical protein
LFTSGRNVELLFLSWERDKVEKKSDDLMNELEVCL